MTERCTFLHLLCPVFFSFRTFVHLQALFLCAGFAKPHISKFQVRITNENDKQIRVTHSDVKSTPKYITASQVLEYPPEDTKLNKTKTKKNIQNSKYSLNCVRLYLHMNYSYFQLVFPLSKTQLLRKFVVRYYGDEILTFLMNGDVVIIHTGTRNIVMP